MTDGSGTLPDTRPGSLPGSLLDLAALALRPMTPFTDLERRMLEAALEGAPAGEVADPAEADGWGPERTVRPEVLAWLCTDPAAVERVSGRGLRLRGVRFTGPVDLGRARIPFPLAFAHCEMGPGMVLDDAEVGRLTLSGCRVGPMRCDRMTAQGTVAVADGTWVLGGVRLSGAVVLGDLVLTGARLVNRGGLALAGTALRVEGDLCMDTGFRALGSVRLIDAAVTGRLDLRGGRCLNRGGIALACDRIQVAGACHLGRGFKAYGRVRFMDARLADARDPVPTGALVEDGRGAGARAAAAR